jgi:hypothetical protein
VGALDSETFYVRASCNGSGSVCDHWWTFANCCRRLYLGSRGGGMPAIAMSAMLKVQDLWFCDALALYQSDNKGATDTSH